MGCLIAVPSPKKCNSLGGELVVGVTDGELGDGAGGGLGGGPDGGTVVADDQDGGVVFDPARLATSSINRRRKPWPDGGLGGGPLIRQHRLS